jgi:ribose-phosphate pyrophosphokinase
MKKPFLVFCTETYADFAAELCALGELEMGSVDRRSFPDGERYRRVLDDVSWRDVVLVGGTVNDADTLELYDLACALVHQGAHTLTLIIPWFGYQTMERAVLPGEVVTAKTRARLLSSISLAGSGNRVVLVDLHSEGITQYFSDPMRPLHLYAKPVVLELIRELGGEDFVLGATDAGRAKWVESLANDLGVQAAFIFKRRLSGDETEVTAQAADVRGKRVIIYDDMIRTGGSLLGAAQAFLDSGATSIAAVATHGVLPGDSLDRIENSGLLEAMACTNTHPRARELGATRPFLRVESVVPLVAELLRRQMR